MANRHTEENLATDFENGRQHDFQLFRHSRSPMTASIEALADAGYQGVGTLHPTSRPSVKKTKFRPLNEEQKACKCVFSKKRILMENIIRKLKIFRILSERYRNRRKRFGLRLYLIAAICKMELKRVH